MFLIRFYSSQMCGTACFVVQYYAKIKRSQGLAEVLKL